MEHCPERVAVAVFVSFLMPAAGKPMVFVFEQLSQETRPEDRYMDCEFETNVAGDHQRPVETFRLGPQYLKQRLYQLSPAEDVNVTLAMAMVRPSQRFRDGMTMMNANVLTAERYGAVRRAGVVAEDDASFQRRMASLNPGTEGAVRTSHGDSRVS
uniref:Uncharacterized protein n=1 Tax=Zea mays TaxID=4577 RepID=A0A804N813_MAIZE